MSAPLAVESHTDTDALHCVTRDPAEAAVADPEYLAVCDDNPVGIFNSVHCPAKCGGHPVCAPCLALGRERGLVR